MSAACSSCSGKSSKIELPKTEVDRSVALFTPEGFGRGCPVNGMIITARHLVVRKDGYRFFDVWWSDKFGHDGYGKTLAIDTGVDGALIEPKGDHPPTPVKTGLPTVGGDIYWFEYDYADDPLASTLHRAILVRRIGGHLILSEGPTEGASGGCIFNSKREAIGIVVWVLANTDEEYNIGIGLQFPKEWL